MNPADHAAAVARWEKSLADDPTGTVLYLTPASLDRKGDVVVYRKLGENSFQQFVYPFTAANSGVYLARSVAEHCVRMHADTLVFRPGTSPVSLTKLLRKFREDIDLVFVEIPPSEGVVQA